MPENDSKEIVVKRQIDINQNDIANIAIAEAELKIKRMIRGLKEQIEENEKKTRQKLNELSEIGKNLTEAAAHKKAVNFIKVFTNLGRLGKKAEHKFEIKTEVGFVTDVMDILNERGREAKNTYTVILSFENARAGINSSMKIDYGDIKIFPQQVATAKEIRKLDEDHQVLVQDSLMWRRRLADIPAIERQFRAKIARIQIGQTEEGQALIDKLVESIDGDIKMLGI